MIGAEKKLITTRESNKIFKPEFFYINDAAQKEEFESLLEQDHTRVFDHMYGQLKELMKIRNPKLKLKEDDYTTLINNHLNGCPIEEYGVWVYYPWSGNMVHILDKDEFIELRTSANRNKITFEERDILATKKVGVIGLSVGQSVSLTLAMERGCGELRIADFDTVELNNLNRLRTGLHNLGLLKAYCVAREIAEIDPFFKVVCYTEGVNENNIHDFFTKGGKLDVVIDECDAVDVKIRCRIKAKELSVPVVMEASDRGTMDVERFDLQPDRPIMHGWLQHLSLDLDFLKTLKTAEEKLPYILPISGLDTLSPRMKASMLEIEHTITTWPQLASAVALGGALTADTCRRIFLDQYTDSGRYFIDLEKLVPDSRDKKEFVVPEVPAPITEEEMSKYASDVVATIKPTGYSPSLEEIKELVSIAIKSPTAGNNQPWKWHYQNDCLFLFHDKHRSKSFGDYEDIASYIGLGTALENLELFANKQNINTVVNVFPHPEFKQLVAAIQFTPHKVHNDLYRANELVQYIEKRCTNRNIKTRLPIDSAVYQSMISAVESIPGAKMVIKDSAEEMNELKEVMAAADRLRLLHPEGHYEFYKKELRWNDEQSRVTADGIDIATVDILPSEIVGLQLVKDTQVADLLAKWKGGKGLERISRKSIDAASAIGLITMPEFTSKNYILGGRAVERMWLTATEHRVSVQPMLATVLHFARLVHGDGMGMPEFMKKEFSFLHERYEKIFPGSKTRAEVFLLRLFIADEPLVKSYRIPLEQVFSYRT